MTNKRTNNCNGKNNCNGNNKRRFLRYATE
jgi:hypothetical protein